MNSESQVRTAYIAPFAVFMLLLGLCQMLQSVFGGGRFIPLASPQYWIYPLQTFVCAAIMVRYRRHYGFGKVSMPLFTVLTGVLALVIWIAPQQFFGQPQRRDGFNPDYFQNHPLYFYGIVFLRFLRSVVAVPFLEEIFWRGFLMRELIDPDFTKVRFGTFSWFSFGVVTAGFCLEHSMADWPAAILTGILYNLVACRTKSLSSCVLAHAVTNLVLGCYIMQTRQWGFW